MTTQSKEMHCSSHTCTECGKDLYPNQIKTSIIVVLIISLPFIVMTPVALLISYFDSTKLEPPYCYAEKEIVVSHILWDKTPIPKVYKRIFVDCDSPYLTN